MIIHNPIISGSIQFPADAAGNKVTLKVTNGTLETIQLDSSGDPTSVTPVSNLSGSFSGSFIGDGSNLTGVSAINIDALSSLGGASVAQGDSLIISDAGSEKKVTFSNLEDSIFGNISGDVTIAAGGASTLASIANSKLANSSITIDGSAISLGGSVSTNNTQLSTEAVQDIAGALVASGGTKTGIAVTYQDGTGDVDFVVSYPSQTDENFTTADHSKLDGIEASATADQTGGEIKTALFNESDTNNLTDTLKSKLDGIEGSATADQTNAEIKAAVEAATDSNTFTDADHSKLDGIEASATADQSNAEIKAAVGAANDSNIFTDTFKNKLNTVETGATADQSLADLNISTSDDVRFDSLGIGVNASGTSGQIRLTSLEVGHATDTTITRVSAGVLAVEGTTVQLHLSEGGFANGDKTKLDGIDASADVNRTDAAIKSSIGTGNSKFVPSAGSAGTFLKHDGTFGTPSYIANTNTQLSSSEVRGKFTAGTNVAIASDGTISSTDTTTNTQLSEEQVQDFVGNMLGGTETGITVTYQDGSNDIDFVVASQTANDFTNTLKSKLDGIDVSADVNRTDSAIKSSIGTGNGKFVPASGTNGHFLKHDGSFGLPSYTTNTDVDVSIANLKIKLAGGFGGNAVSIGDSGDTVTIPGNLTVTGTTTTNNVETVSTSNGVVFEGNAADDNEVTLLAATVSSDRTITLPDATGTIALTSSTVANSTLSANSTLAGGLAIGTGRNDSANQIVRTQANGYVDFGWINTTSGTASGTLSRIYCSQDGYVRYLSPSNFLSSIGIAAGATNVSNNNQITNGAGYITSFDITAQTDGKYLRSNATDTASGAITFSNSTASTTKTTGAVIVTGGVGISGALNVGGDVVAFASSDERLKDNIELISNPIEKVKQLKGVTWDWNSNADILQQTLPNVGVIAQDVEKVLPQLVIDRDNGFKGVDYAKLTGLLIEAIKEQQVQIEELKNKIS